MNKPFLKNILFGIFTWLGPFVISFLFFGPGGDLGISHDLFKSIMMVAVCIAACYFLYRYFIKLDSGFIRSGLMIGLSWFLINILLDVIFLLPMMKGSFLNYFTSIGLRYTLLPVISVTLGYLLHKKLK